MSRADTLARSRPVAFAIAGTVAFVLCLGILGIAAAASPLGLSAEAGGAIGRLLVSGLILAAIVRSEWAVSTGVAVRPTLRAWLVSIPMLAYVVIVYPLLFTGRLGLNLEDPVLSTWVGLNVFAAATMEELVFRGLILAALVGHWGRERSGLLASIALSSALFSAPHALNLLAGIDPIFVLAQLGWSFLLGCVLAVLVVVTGSIWPAIAVHGFANVVVHLNRLGETMEPTPAMGLLMVAAALPMVGYGRVLLRREAGGLT